MAPGPWADVPPAAAPDPVPADLLLDAVGSGDGARLGSLAAEATQRLGLWAAACAPPLILLQKQPAGGHHLGPSLPRCIRSLAVDPGGLALPLHGSVPFCPSASSAARVAPGGIESRLEVPVLCALLGNGGSCAHHFLACLCWLAALCRSTCLYIVVCVCASRLFSAAFASAHW